MTDNHEGWKRNLWLMWGSQMIAIVGFYFVLPFIPLYIQELGVTDPGRVALWAGLLTAGSALFMAISAPVWGALSDRVGRKPMVLRAMLGGAVVLGAMGLVRNVYELFALRILQGLITGTISASIALVATTTPKRRLGYSLGVMQTAVFAGSSFGPFIGGAAADFLGFRRTFFITGGLLLLGGLVVLFFVEERFERGAAVPPLQPREILRSVSQTVRSHGLLVLIVILFLLQIATMTVAPILPLYVQSLERNGLPVATMSGLILAVTGMTGAAGAILSGRLSDDLGYRRVFVLSALVAGLLYVPQAFVSSSVQLLLLRGGLGLFLGGLLPAANALIGTMTPSEKRGSVYGVAAGAQSLGNALGPASGAVVAATVGLRAVFVVTAGLLLALSAWGARAMEGRFSKQTSR